MRNKNNRNQQNIVNVDEALSIAIHAMRAGIHSTLGSSSGSLVFNRDIFLHIPLIANWHAITQKREHPIHEISCKKIRKGDGMIALLNSAH
jgi:hypothetical protein